MRRIKTILLSLLLLSYPALVFGQGFGDTMRSNGRIYVVVAVMLTILAGLILYLVRLDRKISKMEREHGGQ